MSEQKSTSWFKNRIGKWNGSEVGKLMGNGRKNDEIFSQTAISYMYKVAGERNLNPRVLEDDGLFEEYLNMSSFSNKYTDWGTEMEELARQQFANKYLVSVEEVGSCVHPNIPTFAASPDGIYHEDGKKMCLEVKSPKIDVFMVYMHKCHDWESLKKINPDYYWQCNAEISCTESDGISFCVFNPFAKIPLLEVRLMRNEDAIKELTDKIMLAEEYIEGILCKA